MIEPAVRTRRTPALALALAVAVALAASACNPGRPPAATVGRIDISAQRVDDLVAAFAAADTAFAEDIEGPGADTYAKAWATDALRILVTRAAAAELARDRRAIVDSTHHNGAEDELARSLLPGDAEKGAAIVEALAEGTREWLRDLTASGLALQADLTADGPVDPEIARRYYDDSDQFDQVCLRLLVVAPDDLDGALNRIDSGEDFGEVSAEISVDPEVAERQGGGDCALLSQLQQQLQGEPFEQIMAVPEGGVVGPFQYDEAGNVVLVEVTPREKVPFEDVVDQLTNELPGDARLEALIRHELDGLGVRIDPRFGRWDPEDLTVVAPTAPGR